MGARAQVRVKDTVVLLYTHWGSSTLIKDIKKAIARRQRWDDPEYLTRIIFETMIVNQKAIGEETGFGIGTSEHCDLDYNPIIVDCKKRTVTHHGLTLSFEQLLDTVTK